MENPFSRSRHEQQAERPFEYPQHLTDRLYIEYIANQHEGASDVRAELEMLFFRDPFMTAVRETETDWGEWRSQGPEKLSGFDAAQEHTYWDDEGRFVLPVNDEVYWEFDPAITTNEKTGEMDITVRIRRVRGKDDDRAHESGDRRVLREIEQRIRLHASPKTVAQANELIRNVEEERNAETHGQTLLAGFMKSHADKKMTGRELLKTIGGDVEAFNWITMSMVADDTVVEIRDKPNEWDVLVYENGTLKDIFARTKPEKHE